MRKLLFTFLLCLVLTASVLSQPFAPDQKPPLGIQIDRGKLLSHGLVAYWLFNEDSGNIVFDLSGNGHTGTLVDHAHFVPGKFGSAIDFDGVDEGATGDRITFGTKPLQIYSATALSIVMRIYPHNAANGSNSQYLLHNLLGSNDTIETWLDDNGRVSFKLNTSAGNATINNADTIAVDNKWQQIICTWNGTTMRLYLDLVPSGETQALGGISASGVDNTTLFGGRTNAYFYDGLLDNLAVYNRALSASEIAQLYREPFCMFKPSWNWMLFGGISVPTVGGQVIWINMN